MPAFAQAAGTLTEQLIDQISRMILSGALQPGERLHEALIAQQVGVSRGPVREAIRALQEQGLVTYSPNRGAWVRDLNLDEAREILTLRILLEGFAARLAVVHLGADQIQVLSAIVGRMRDVAAQQQFAALAELDIEFHHSFSALARNRALSHHIALLSKQARPSVIVAYMLRRDPQTLPVIHEELLAHLSMADPDGAERAIRAHIESAGELFLDELRRRHAEREPCDVP